ncbi:MAG: porin [Lysobacter sp.]|nr:porin [Lysobacter sp.]
MQHAHRYTRLTALALGITGALALGQVHASGFQLKENSVKAMGRAFAGSGVAAGDTSVVANNPAAMTQFEGTTFQADVTVIDLNAKFNGGGYDVLGRPLTGGDGGEAGDVTPVPAMSLIHKFDNGLSVGAMVSAPFGLKTEYKPGWVGRYYAAKSELKTVDLTLSAAFELVPDHLSVGAGIVWEKAEAELSKSVDFGTLLFGNPATRPLPFARPQAADGFAKVEGDDTGLGWIIGVNLRPNDKLAIGLSHRSEIDHELEGNVDWTVPGNVAAVFGASPTTRPLFQDGKALAKLTTPSVTTLSVEYKFTDRFSLMADYSETDWSSLQEIRIDFANPDPDSVEHFGWNKTRFMALGGEFQLNDAWTLRAGYAYDETPTTYATRTPRLPDEDRRWYSLGATWDFSENLELNFSYVRIEPDTPQIGIVTPPAAGGQRLFGSYSSNVNLFGVSAQYHF